MRAAPIKFQSTDYTDDKLRDLRAAGQEGTRGFLLAMSGKQTSYLVRFTHRGADAGFMWDNMRFAANTAAEAMFIARQYTSRILGWDIIRVTAKDSCVWDRFADAERFDSVTCAKYGL